MKEKDENDFNEEKNINNENHEYTEVKREITTEIETFKVKVKDDDQYLNAIKNKNKLAVLNNQGKVIEILKLKTFEKIINLAGENLSDSYDKISFAIYSNEEIKIFEGNEVNEKSAEELKNINDKKEEEVTNEQDILKRIIKNKIKEKEKEEEKYSSEDKFVIFASLAGLIVYLSKFVAG